MDTPFVTLPIEEVADMPSIATNDTTCARTVPTAPEDEFPVIATGNIASTEPTNRVAELPDTSIDLDCVTVPTDKVEALPVTA